MALSGALIEDTDGLEALRADWDALAVGAGRPYCAPAWMLAWWRHVGSSRGPLRVVAVRRDGDLVGLAPFYAQREGLGRPTRYRLLAADLSHRIEPLAAPGSEREVAEAIASALAEARPRPALVSFESIDAGSGWPTLLARAWPGPGRAALERLWTRPALTIRLEDTTFEEWLQRRSRKFRGYSRRNLKQLEEHGAEFRLARSEEELERGLAEFVALHERRWVDRGGSVALSGGVEGMLAEAGRELLASERLRLFTVAVDGHAISANLFVAAGGEVAYWNGGFDPDWSHVQPSLRGIESAIRDAIDRGERRLDLGGGTEQYKYRLADGEGELETTLLLPPGARRPLTRLQLAPRALARRARARLRDG
jgi:CelD/BcsL family acetyltransferase involved in cellulose biosynthesis